MVRDQAQYEGIPLEDVFSACKRAVGHLHWDIESSSASEGFIQAKTPASLRSWGETIMISVWEREGSIAVKVESKPTAQIFDWGKGEENIERFFDELDDILSV